MPHRKPAFQLHINAFFFIMHCLLLMFNDGGTINWIGACLHGLLVVYYSGRQKDRNDS